MKYPGLLFFLLFATQVTKAQNSDTSLINLDNFRLTAGTYSWREGNTFHDMTRWDSSPYTEGHLQQRSGSSWLFRMNYRLLLPANYDRNYDKGYPILIMFHGAGERANCWVTNCYCTDCDANQPETGKADVAFLNNDHMLVHGGQPFMNAVNRAGSKKADDPSLDPRAFPGFVLFPQMENNWGSAESANSTVAHALRILRLVVRQHNINPNRIYIAGLSMGGQAVLKSLTMADWLFAAAIAMSPVPFTRDFDYEGSVNVPMWIFQGGKDEYPKPSQTEAFIKRFRQTGGSVRYTFYEELGHNTWTRAFGEPEFFSWLLKRKKSEVFRYFETDRVCETSDDGLKMSMPAGFPAYQWERDGKTISTETTHVLVAKEKGKYRGRFSRVINPRDNDWNEWSDVIELGSYAPNTPDLKHEGTTFLPDLNGTNEAILFTAEGYPYHYWDRNGSALVLPDSNRVAVKETSGSYSIRVANYDQCKSLPSRAVPVFVNNQAPVRNEMRPASLVAEPFSSSSVLLSWTDASLENGYEIWRKNISRNGSRWELATITKKNATYYYDTRLMPGSVYHYKIRGINNEARSDYFPSNNTNENISVELSSENDIPFPPQNLVAELIDVNTVRVVWHAGKDESGISEYIINYGDVSVSTGKPDTTYVLKDLAPSRNYAITVQTVDISGNKSTHSNQYIISTAFTGLFYRHSTGAWNSLADPAITDTWNDPEYRGKVDMLSLSPRVQDEYFNFEFNGYLRISTGGPYTFYLNSDDGSQLFVGNDMIIDYDGFHSTCQGNSASTTCPNGWGMPSQPTNLSSGIHPIKIRFFQYTGGRSLSLRYSGPDTGYATIIVPAEAYSTGSAPTIINLQPPVGLSANAQGMTSIKLQWQASPTNGAQYEVYRSLNSNGAFEIVGRTDGTSFDNNNLRPGTTYFYRLRSTTNNGTSGFTSVARATTTSDKEPPSTPQELRVEGGNMSKAVLRWARSTDNVGVHGYEVWGNKQRIGFTGVPAFDADDLISGEFYEFYVVAIDVSGNRSAESERVNNESIITDTERASANFKLQIYPNPTTAGEFAIVVEGASSRKMSMSLIDILKREVWSSEIDVTEASVIVRPDLRLGNGLYILQADDGMNKVKRRIIVKDP